MANGLLIWDVPEAGGKNFIVTAAVSQLRIANVPEYELQITFKLKKQKSNDNHYPLQNTHS